MPSQTTTIGINTLPVPAGSFNSDLTDFTEDGLLDYLAFWVKNTLDTKLQNMQADPTVTDACPVANRFTYDPQPGQMWVRNGTPALYVFWDGEARDVQYTLVYRHIERTLKALYIFNELNIQGEEQYHCGLTNMVALAWFKAAERGRHPLYAYGSDALGTPIGKSLNLVEWWCVGAKDGVQWMIPGGAPSAGVGLGEGNVQRGHPFVAATFKVVERIGPDTLVIPDDVLNDSPLVIATGPSVADTVDIMERVLTPPDGSDPSEP